MSHATVTPVEPETNLERDLYSHFIRVVEAAAMASARTMGIGDRKRSDHAAVQAMRQAFETVPINGNIVIGEGERDEAPMLYIGERVGMPSSNGSEFPGVDIAVDPLEGTNLCATGAANAIAVLAASEPGGLLHAPDCYMEKIVAGPACRGALDLDAPVSQNLKSIARRLDRDVKDLTIIVLDRPRHEQLIDDIRREGARIRLIGDGDLSAAIAVAVRGNGVHAVMGIGGAPEGVLAAAAMRCLAWRDGGPPCYRYARTRRTCGAYGYQEPAAYLHRWRPRHGNAYHLRRLRRHRWRAAARCSLFRRRLSNPYAAHDL